MANALKTLFQDIADAIKEKTGETETMKPAEFPEKISGISTGTNAEILENIPIELDFSSGNQTIAAPDGTLVKTAIIQKPDALIPENIAQGVDIAGIIGTLAGGGSGGGSEKTYLYKTGDFRPNGTPFTVAHGLGVVPDLVGVYLSSGTERTASTIVATFMFSNAGVSAFGGKAPGTTLVSNNGVMNMTFGQGTNYIEKTDVPLAGIYAANKDSFNVGGVFATLDPDSYYNFFAVGGLF